MSTFCIDAP